MTMRLWVTAGLLGLALGASIGTAPAMAQVLRVQEGQADSTLQVPMNRAVVVESDIQIGRAHV